MLDFLKPSIRTASVLDLSLERLAELGVEALLLDVDCTLKPYLAEEPAPEGEAEAAKA